MICPLMSGITQPIIDYDVRFTPVPCKQFNCMWWMVDEKKCAVALISQVWCTPHIEIEPQE